MANFISDPMNGYLWQNVVDSARSGGAAWNGHPLSFGTFRIFENRAYCEVAGAIYHDTVPPTADYVVTCDYYLKTDMGTIGVAGRISTSAATYYTAYYAGGQLVLAKMVAGALSVIDTAAQAWVAGNHTLSLEMVGTGLGVVWDGATVITAVDASIADAGRAGIRSGSPNDAHIGKHIDNFRASDDTTLAIGRSQVVAVIGF